MEPVEYTNPGKGYVMQDRNATAELANLFSQKNEWTSAELNERLGWQFSQAVYHLRKKGWAITTLHNGGRKFSYRWENQNASRPD